MKTITQKQRWLLKHYARLLTPNFVNPIAHQPTLALYMHINAAMLFFASSCADNYALFPFLSDCHICLHIKAQRILYVLPTCNNK
jgi:hypothetical protein